jgi:hypothetical protein
MRITIKPSDLQYRYPKDVPNRDLPKFQGKPDPAPFNRDDLYDVIPLLEAAMEELGTTEGRILHSLEEVLNLMPRFITTREEVFDYLVGSMREILRS